MSKAAIYRATIPAKGHSSPIVWGERVFLTGEGDRIMAFDRASGKLLWNTMLKSADGMGPSDDEGFKTVGNDTGMAAPTACTDGKQVYAFFGNGLIGCVTVDGRQVWAKRLVRSKPRNIYGLAASPVLYGDLLIQVFDQGSSPDDKLSFIVALRTKDGAVARTRSPRSFWLEHAAHRPRSKRRRTRYRRGALGYCLRTGDGPRTLACPRTHRRRGSKPGCQ